MKIIYTFLLILVMFLSTANASYINEQEEFIEYFNYNIIENDNLIMNNEFLIFLDSYFITRNNEEFELSPDSTYENNIYEYGYQNQWSNNNCNCVAPPSSQVPEPITVLLLGTGFIYFSFRKRKDIF